MARRLSATRDHHTAYLVVKAAINMMHTFVGTSSWQKTRSCTSEWDLWFRSVFKIKLSRDETITIKENQCFAAIFEGFLLPLKPNNRIKSLHFSSAKLLTWRLRPLPSTHTLAHITGGPSLSLQPPFPVVVSQLSYIWNTQWFVFHTLDSFLFIFCRICLLNLCIKVQKYVFVFVIHTQLGRVFDHLITMVN